jgi:acetyl esterase/lipase
MTDTIRTDVPPVHPAVTSYPAADGFAGPRPAVLVLPGGGFRFHAAHEGEGYARWLSGLGLHAFVLDYPLMTDHRFPAPLVSSRQVLGWIRDGDHGLAVDTGRVGVIGSSSGGHLAGLLVLRLGLGLSLLVIPGTLGAATAASLATIGLPWSAFRPGVRGRPGNSTWVD